jgi:hypothetical protein
MRLAVLPLLVLSLVSPVRAADPQPSPLTPKEIAAGWLLLFDGQTTFGWTIDGDAKITGGTLILGGTRPTRATLPLLPGPQVVRFECEGPGTFVFQSSAGTGSSVLVGTRRVVECEIKPGQTGEFTSIGRLEPGPGGVDRHLETIKYDLAQGHRFALEVEAGKMLQVKNVKAHPRGLKPIFNGKDLSGWKQYTGEQRRNRSTFTVTRDGWLHMKSGPGDLQSEGRYDDFVLQLECMTNGKHLNSGVFFRCIPGQYQNGYEAQVHNNFTADPPREYTVDLFDPKTHELKEKQKVKSAASDFGTAAIYRRVPARRGVAKDGEWFTMTVVAQGRHIATWVNGIQQVDWTDNRPLNENPRSGCRLDRGAISFQGHDPTTDINIRNIRIAEIPRGKNK